VRGLLGAFRAEWLRVSTGRALLLLPLAFVLAAAYALSLGVAAERGLFGAPTGFYLAAAASTGAAITCAAVGALLSASAVGGDFASGVARTALVRPVGRAVWLLGRLLALNLGVAVLFLGCFLGALVAGWARFGLGDVQEAGYVLAPGSMLFGQLLMAVAISIVGQAVAVAAGGVLGMAFGRSGPAVAATAVLGAALVALGRWPEVEGLLPTTFLTAGLDRVSQLAQGLSTLHPTDVAPRALLVFALWLFGVLAMGAALLQRKDIVS
jgi:ABC-type transport system involved in multi-copper enzyme maturation permease subunit